MKLDWIRRIVQPKPAVAELTSVRRGTQHVKGVVKSGPELLRSPQKGVSCVAFFYRAYYQVQGRTGMTERNLKAIEVHTPVFFLEMEGGNLRVVSNKVATFGPEEHQKVASCGMQQLRIEEQAVKPGSHISIIGRVFDDEEGLSIRTKEIRLIEAPSKRTFKRAKPTRKQKTRRRAH